MRIVFDTHVILSGFLTATGTCQHILSRGLKRHQIYLSEFILHELETKLDSKIRAPKEAIRTLLQYLRRHTRVLDVDAHPDIQFEDPDDIPLLSLAEKSGAHYLITGDKALLKLKKFKSVLILSPREAMEFL